MKPKITKCYEFKTNANLASVLLRKFHITQYDFNGRAIERMYYQSTDRDPSQQLTMKTVYRHRDDRLTEELHYKPIDQLRQKKLYQYNKDGRLIYTKYYWTTGRVIHENFYRYDNHGRRIEWVCHDYDLNDKSMCRYYYSTKGQLIKTGCYSKLAGSILWEYKYDENGNLIEEAEYDGDGEFPFRTVNIYDSNGRKTRKDFYGKNGKYVGYMTFEYDARGNCITMTSHNNESMEIVESTYNKHGDILSAQYYRIYRKTPAQKDLYQQDVFEYEYYTCLEILWSKAINLGKRLLRICDFAKPPHRR